MKKNNLSILIADDHPIVLEGLIKLIKEGFDNAKITKASSGKNILTLSRKTSFDLIILDISMPDSNGLDVLKQLTSEGYKTPVLFLSMYPEDQFALRAIRAGAFGYLTKSSATEELINAISTILSGKKYITPALSENLVNALQKNMPEVPHEKLSDRELDVLLMIASGKTINEIAEMLSLSAATVSTYRKRLLGKMGMKNNSELTNYAIKNKLVI